MVPNLVKSSSLNYNNRGIFIFQVIHLPRFLYVIPSIDKEISSDEVSQRIRRDVIKQSVDVAEPNTRVAVQHFLQQTERQN